MGRWGEACVEVSKKPTISFSLSLSLCYCTCKSLCKENIQAKLDFLEEQLHGSTHGHTAQQKLQHICRTQWKEMQPSFSVLAVISCMWLVLCTFCVYWTVPEIKCEPVARSCELINVLRSAYSTPLYSSARLQLWQSIQSAALMNPLQSSWEQAGAASFN